MELDEAEQIALAKALEAITVCLRELKETTTNHADRLARLELERGHRQ